MQRSLAIRSSIILVATLLATFWLLFAVANFPLIVPADHNSEIVEEHERAATAGLWLFGGSLGTVCLAAGFFGKKRAMYVLAVAILIAWLGVSPILYPSLDIMQFPIRLFAHMLGAAMIFGGVVVVAKSEKVGVD